VTSRSWSDDDSDSNDAMMTSCRDVTAAAGRRAVQQSSMTVGVVEPAVPPRSPINAVAADHVELFDVYYVLPASSRPPLPSSRWAWRGRNGEFKCLLDAVPPTPGCYNDRRAATLPAEWSSLPPPSGLVSVEIILLTCLPSLKSR